MKEKSCSEKNRGTFLDTLDLTICNHPFIYTSNLDDKLLGLFDGLCWDIQEGSWKGVWLFHLYGCCSLETSLRLLLLTNEISRLIFTAGWRTQPNSSEGFISFWWFKGGHIFAIWKEIIFLKALAANLFHYPCQQTQHLLSHKIATHAVSMESRTAELCVSLGCPFCLV